MYSNCYIETLQNLNACPHQVCPTRSVGSVAPSWQYLTTRVCTPYNYHKICLAVMLYPPYSPDLTPSNFLLFGPWKGILWWLTTLCIWWGTAECFMPMAAQERKQLLLGGSTCSCSKVEEELATLEINLENTYVSSNVVVKLPEIFVCLTWEWLETKKKGITCWLALLCC